MTKILLVEDDKSLQEIYGVRLGSEGYKVVIANDGEEALQVALKEKPELILSDVMMPKISGFDMLDILRTTPEIQNIKVIIMTALSSDDQRERGEKLGADLYLVKSQVGIEDVVQAVKNVLSPPAPQSDAPAVSNEALQTEISYPDHNPTPITTDNTETLANSAKPTEPIFEQPLSQSDFHNSAFANNPSYQAPIPTQELFSSDGLNQNPTHSANSNFSDTNHNINPQYRQPVSLRDIIPPRELDK